jgi:hypothetical protein
VTETAVAVRQTEPTLTAFEVIERVITQGDLAKMSAQDRVAFYWKTCESLKLNPLTRPFEFIALNGKLTLYARKDATDQLRKLNGVSVTDVRREKDDELGLLTVYARGRDKTGREDEATGVVSIKGLGGEALANAVMKAETKAKRRLTLSLVGLGFLDESEIEGRGDVDVDPTTGEITERPKPKSLLESVKAQQAAMATSTDESPADPGVEVDVVEGAVTEAPAGLTHDELKAALAEAGISLDFAVERSKVLFPREQGVPLTDEQRAELLADLTPATVADAL